jgi:two-component system invasion response regulator UvrY
LTAVLIADDHSLIRSGLKQLLASEGSIRQIGECQSGTDALAKLKEQHWDLLILDIHMPDRNGLEVLKEARESFPKTRVLMLSGLPSNQYELAVLRAGASGYLSKDLIPRDLLSAVRTVLQGRRYVSAGMTAAAAALDEDDMGKSAHSVLSKRELQIFLRLAAGESATRIAEDIGISVKTVSTYRSRILEKMHFETAADLTAYAVRNKLI